MKNVRLFFKKYGPLRFVSHLDMNRVMTRLLRLSKLPIWYTEGFNRHPYITFAVPLSLGFCSEYEVMDFKLTDDDFSLTQAQKMLIEVFPKGLEVISLKEPIYKSGKIAFADFNIFLLPEAGADKTSLENFLNQKSIIVYKNTKKGQVKELELADKIKSFTVTGEENAPQILSLRLPAGGEENINPKLLIDNYLNSISGKKDFYTVNRTGLFLTDNTKFE